MSYPTIRLYLSAARYHHIIEGDPEPSFKLLTRLQDVLCGCHRTLPNSVWPSHLLITPSILHLLHTSWSCRADDYDTVCTWAACCITFLTFPRCGEFTCNSLNSNNGAVLSFEDIAINSRDDPTIVHLTLWHSKSYIFGIGLTIHLVRTGDLLCPVSALLAYLARQPPTSGPLFLLESGQPLSKQTNIHSAQHLDQQVWMLVDLVVIVSESGQLQQQPKQCCQTQRSNSSEGGGLQHSLDTYSHPV